MKRALPTPLPTPLQDPPVDQCARWPGFVALAAISFFSLALWWTLNRPQPLPSWDGMLNAVAFSPFQADQDPRRGAFPSAREIARDLALVGTRSRRVRSYTVEGSLGLIPELAGKLGLEVVLGAWIGPEAAANQREVAQAIGLARRQASVAQVLIGNEVLLRGDLPLEDLIAQLRRARAALDQPVSTAEPWHVWLGQPRLAAEVDFLAVHILPYWEGISVERALDYVDLRLRQLRAAFPDKPILLSEVGWPSDGPVVGQAVASRVNQAAFLRGFLNRAAQWQVDYAIVEAFDQPWKFSIEGETGAYWGLYDAARGAKFPWTGPVLEHPDWPLWAALATLLGLLPALFYLLVRRRLAWAGQSVFMLLSFTLAAALVWSLRLPFETYLGPFGPAVWSVLLVAEIVLLASLSADGVELTGALWHKDGAQSTRPWATRSEAGTVAPKVSIHVPCCDEPAAMVRRTLGALSRLDYPGFEVLLVDNNSKDSEATAEIARACARLGPRFRFLHLADCPGFKAGALNHALARTAPDAAVIAVVDSDYLVAPDWLAELVPAFADPGLALVQAPQDYRDGGAHPFKAMCYWEYAAFFRIGMVERNRANAIIQHGTMTLIRRPALESVGGWGEWCITEDAELGLRLLAAGWRSRYVARSYGRGLVPDSLAAYKRQRFRWAYGAVQILKRHWRELLLPGGSRLSWAQRYHFLTGWLPWCTDALGLVCTLAAILWSFALAVWPASTVFPETAFLAPVLGAFLFKHARAGLLYGGRVGGGVRRFAQATLAAQALGHEIAKAMLLGLATSGKAFQRTPKCRARPGRLRSLAMVREELAVLVLLAAAFASVALARGLGRSEGLLWLAVLAVQSVPYFAAVSLSLISSLAPRSGRGRQAALESKPPVAPETV